MRLLWDDTLLRVRFPTSFAVPTFDIGALAEIISRILRPLGGSRVWQARTRDVSCFHNLSGTTGIGAKRRRQRTSPGQTDTFTAETPIACRMILYQTVNGPVCLLDYLPLWNVRMNKQIKWMLKPFAAQPRKPWDGPVNRWLVVANPTTGEQFKRKSEWARKWGACIVPPSKITSSRGKVEGPWGPRNTYPSAKAWIAFRVFPEESHPTFIFGGER